MFYLLKSTYESERAIDIIFLKSAVQKIYAFKFIEDESFYYELIIIIQDDSCIGLFKTQEEVIKIIEDLTGDKNIANDYIIPERINFSMNELRRKMKTD